MGGLCSDSKIEKMILFNDLALIDYEQSQALFRLLARMWRANEWQMNGPFRFRSASVWHNPFHRAANWDVR